MDRRGGTRPGLERPEPVALDDHVPAPTGAEDVMGNCDEAEHASDPECVGVNPVVEDDHENDDQGDVNDDQGENENDDDQGENDDDQGDDDQGDNSGPGSENSGSG